MATVPPSCGIGIGMRPPARNSAVSPLTTVRFGWASTRIRLFSRSAETKTSKAPSAISPPPKSVTVAPSTSLGKLIWPWPLSVDSAPPGKIGLIWPIVLAPLLVPSA